MIINVLEDTDWAVSGSGFEFWTGCVRQRLRAYLLLAVSPLEAEWGSMVSWFGGQVLARKRQELFS